MARKEGGVFNLRVWLNQLKPPHPEPIVDSTETHPQTPILKSPLTRLGPRPVRFRRSRLPEGNLFAKRLSRVASAAAAVACPPSRKKGGPTVFFCSVGSRPPSKNLGYLDIVSDPSARCCAAQKKKQHSPPLPACTAT
ncbi:hypothetical protein H6P81_013565 [Aristolochia fimbriata]|uniref:Uncharacterized protein n=1 Tax=Aristolochia fimbriata TaxID=158543 RepID=A0AAV7EIC1_ARIFI|nr:hypothetical protein H6P81_013565 [Aristolochia fimbriata]